MTSEAQIDLTNFAYSKQLVDEATVAQKEEMAALKEEIEGRFQLKERQRTLQMLREVVEDEARHIHAATGDKTIAAVGGKVNIAVRRAPQIIMEDTVIEYLQESHPAMVNKLLRTQIDKKAFGKWWKAMQELGEEIPGVKVSETLSVRITVAKDFDPNPAEDMPKVDIEQVDTIEF